MEPAPATFPQGLPRGRVRLAAASSHLSAHGRSEINECRADTGRRQIDRCDAVSCGFSSEWGLGDRTVVHCIGSLPLCYLLCRNELTKARGEITGHSCKKSMTSTKVWMVGSAWRIGRRPGVRKYKQTCDPSGADTNPFRRARRTILRTLVERPSTQTGVRSTTERTSTPWPKVAVCPGRSGKATSRISCITDV